MRKTAVIPASLTAALLLATAAGCGKMELPGQESRVEMTVLPESEEAVTRGYSEGDEFNETTSQTLHSGTKAVSPRTMQLSAYLHPQSGAASDYFVGKTFSRSESGPAVWYNTNTVGGAHDPIYWPVGGKLDFLAYSLSAEGTKAVTAKWDADDASSAVVLTVPGENSQNDILYASAYDIPSSRATEAVNLGFRHAQAWLEFELTGTPAGAVKLERIEIRNVYNAGRLELRNGNGRASAVWDFADEYRKDISVDNPTGVSALGATPQFLDMLLPQQAKTSFVIYYTEGTSPAVEKSHTIDTDRKTWLMGEKYIYRINISASEIAVSATSTKMPVE